MTLQDLKNIQAFLARVPLTGPESIAWCQAQAAVQAEIGRLSAPPPVDNAHVAPGCEKFSEAQSA
jgi:hypothetical protein